MTAESDPPLPRRAGRSHLEPQLRVPWSAGDGTPFTAFDADAVEEHDEPERCHQQAAEFHDGAERGRADIS